MSYIATFVHTYVYTQETLVQAADGWDQLPWHSLEWEAGTTCSYLIRLLYQTKLRAYKAALIVAYLILYRLPCHHILQVTMAIVYVCMWWSMVHVCQLRTPKVLWDLACWIAIGCHSYRQPTPINITWIYIYVPTASVSESGLHPLSTSHTPTTLHDVNTTSDNGDEISLNAVVPIISRKHVHIYTCT